MTAETILVDAVPGEMRAAALAGGRLVDLWIARGDPRHGVGAILLGRVAQVVAGFDGAFVDIGLEQAAFLRLSDAPRPPRAGDALPVQIVRAVAGEKGLGVSARPRLSGRWLDWTPGRPGLRAGRGAGGALPAPGLAAEEGAELRADAGAAPAGAIAEEVARHRTRWTGIAAAAARTTAPSSLLPASPPWLSLARHHGTAVVAIAFADRAALADAQRLAREAAPDLLDRLALDPSGLRAFEAHGVEEAIAAALTRRVPLDGGGALTIDEGEALTAIDVDAGASRAAPRAINRAAVPAIAAALRLRAIGGQIVVDLVREGGAKAREEIVAAMRAATAGDPDPVEIAGWSRLGLLEMTRRRSRPSLAALLADAPADRAPAPVARGYEALRALAREAGPGVAALAIAAGPRLADRLAGDLSRDLAALAGRLGIVATVRTDASLGPTGFRIVRGSA